MGVQPSSWPPIASTPVALRRGLRPARRWLLPESSTDAGRADLAFPTRLRRVLSKQLSADLRPGYARRAGLGLLLVARGRGLRGLHAPAIANAVPPAQRKWKSPCQRPFGALSRRLSHAWERPVPLPGRRRLLGSPERRPALRGLRPGLGYVSSLRLVHARARSPGCRARPRGCPAARLHRSLLARGQTRRLTPTGFKRRG